MNTIVHTAYWIETYGCQMNIAESNALEEALIHVGLKKAASAEVADCVILNTCSVRKSAENRIWGRIGYFKHLKDHHRLTLIITGCMAERLKDDFMKEAPCIDYVMGTNDKYRIAALLCGGSDAHEESYSFTTHYHKEGDITSFVPIMNGCNNFCSYCIVPYVRGREVSRDINSIIDEVQRLDDAGVKEITLLGQNVNSYSYHAKQGELRFPDLLSAIAPLCNSIRYIRFESPHPKDFSQDLIQVLASERVCARHIHLPAQSGSTRILSLMNRRYSRERYLQIIEDLRSAIPDITFTTDMMVGFPSESEEDFELTLSLMKEVRFLEAFMYYFNPREGTAAYTMEGQLDSEIKLARLQHMIDLQRDISHQIKLSSLQKRVDILIEQISKRDAQAYLGRTEHNQMVIVPVSEQIHIGDVATVQLLDVVGNTFTSTLV